jgi:hypothetical protein
MKLIVLIVLFILAVQMMAVPAAGEDRLPNWEEGDTWEYSISTSFGNVTLTQVVEGEETLSVNGTQYDVYSVNSVMNLSFSGVDISYPSTYYNRRSDLALIKTEMSISIFGISSESVATYNPPKKEFNFPLAVGNTWSETCNAITYSVQNGAITDYNEYEQTFSYSVEEVEEITVPAGTFRCYKIVCVDDFGDETTTWYSPKVKNFVKQTTGDSWDSTETELTSYDVATLEGEGESEGSGVSSLFEMPYLLFLLIIPIIVIVLVVALVTRRNRKKNQTEFRSLDTAGYSVPGTITPQTQVAQAPQNTAALGQQPASPVGTQTWSVQQTTAAPGQPIVQPRQFQQQAPPAQQQPPPPPPPPPPVIKNPCPTCRQDLSLIHKYNRWYCQTCGKYW